MNEGNRFRLGAQRGSGQVAFGGETRFAPPMQWRLWCGLRSFPKPILRYPPEVAGLKNLWVAVDPLLPFKIGPMNGRKAFNSGQSQAGTPDD